MHTPVVSSGKTSWKRGHQEEPALRSLLFWPPCVSLNPTPGQKEIVTVFLTLHATQKGLWESCRSSLTCLLFVSFRLYIRGTSAINASQCGQGSKRDSRLQLFLSFAHCLLLQGSRHECCVLFWIAKSWVNKCFSRVVTCYHVVTR